MDITSGFRSLPFSPSLSHSGPDQPTNTQVHEPGYGSALTGQHQEAPGYDFIHLLHILFSVSTLEKMKLNVFVCLSGTRKSFDHLISDSKAPKRPEMETGMTTPPKMRRVAENDYEIGRPTPLACPSVFNKPHLV